MLYLKVCLGTKKTLNFLMPWQEDTEGSQCCSWKHAVWWGMDVNRAEGCVCWLTSGKPSQLFLFLPLPFPAFLHFYSFSWGFCSWRARMKHRQCQGMERITGSWELLESRTRLPFIGMLGPWVLLIRIQCHTWAGLVLFPRPPHPTPCYSALGSPPMLVVLSAAG